MRTLILLAAVMAVACFSMPSNAVEEEVYYHTSSLGVRAWLGFGTFETDDSIGLGVTGEYLLSDELSIEAAVDYMDYTINLAGVGLDAETWVTSLSGKYYFWQEGLFAPYAGLGISYFWNDVDGFGLSVDNELGWHVTTGSDLFLTDDLALNFEWKYQWVDSDTIDLDGWSAFVGIKYFMR